MKQTPVCSCSPKGSSRRTHRTVPLTDVVVQPRLTKSGLIPSLPPWGFLLLLLPRASLGRWVTGLGYKLHCQPLHGLFLVPGASEQRYVSAVPGLE